MINDTDIAWLAGLIDGEGCIYMRRVQPGKQNSLETRLEIHTPSIRMFEKVVSLLDGLGVGYNLEIGRMQKMSTRPANKIKVSRKQDLNKLLLIILPYLYVKLPEAEVMLEYLSKACNVFRYKVSDVDYEYIEKLKELKRIS